MLEPLKAAIKQSFYDTTAINARFTHDSSVRLIRKNDMRNASKLRDIRVDRDCRFETGHRCLAWIYCLPKMAWIGRGRPLHRSIRALSIRSV